MFKKTSNTNLFFILAIIVASLIAAFIIEHVLGHQPCKLCIYERIPYILSVFLLLEIIFFKKHIKITLLLLSLVFFLSSILAFYHVGIEQGFFKESLVCLNENSLESLSKDELLEELNQNIISCKDVSFKVLGLSLATINVIFSLFLGVIFTRLYLNYGKNQ